MTNPRVPSEIPIRAFLTALASPDEPHGAVSASAVAGGMGASLLRMVAALPKTKSDSADDRMMLLNAHTALGEIQQQLLETIETETAVKIFAARNMPRASETQRTERQAAIQVALRAGADVPIEVMRLCALGLLHAETVAGRCSRAAFSDVELAVALLRAGFAGARANLEMKLISLTNVVYTKAVVEEMARLTDEATAAAHAAETLVRAPHA
jgi:formiminotetrahydrofolate cyclodeaminase